LQRAYSLQELLDRKHFKTYDELKARLLKALGSPQPQATTPYDVSDEENEMAPPPSAGKTAPSWDGPTKSQASTPWDDDDDDMEFFKKLAKD
jgi:hypothetical protein